MIFPLDLQVTPFSAWGKGVLSVFVRTKDRDGLDGSNLAVETRLAHVEYTRSPQADAT
jgi:hypothetical protein